MTSNPIATKTLARIDPFSLDKYDIAFVASPNMDEFTAVIAVNNRLEGKSRPYHYRDDDMYVYVEDDPNNTPYSVYGIVSEEGMGYGDKGFMSFRVNLGRTKAYIDSEPDIRMLSYEIPARDVQIGDFLVDYDIGAFNIINIVYNPEFEKYCFYVNSSARYNYTCLAPDYIVNIVRVERVLGG